MEEELRRRLNRAYDQHPLNAEAILERLLRNGVGSPFNVFDFAIDRETGITDQNHIGELATTVEISREVSMERGARILDVGSGLGGAGRVWAYLYDCAVLGVELNANRVRDALRLDVLVGLDNDIRNVQADFMNIVIDQAFDVIVFLDSFNHFREKPALLGRCRDLLKTGGRIVIQDAFLRTPNEAALQLSEFRQLTSLWNVEIVRWDELARQVSDFLAVEAKREMTEDLKRHLYRMLGIYVDREDLSASEKDAWRLGLFASSTGIIEYNRLVLVAI